MGSFAVQLAAQAGAHIIATALPEDHDYLRSLGPSELVDRDGDVAAAVRASHRDGIDALIDLVSYTPDAFADLRGGAQAKAGAPPSPLPPASAKAPGRHAIMAAPDPTARWTASRSSSTPALCASRSSTAIAWRAPPRRSAPSPATHTQGKLAITIS